jgi:hypothetical protein
LLLFAARAATDRARMPALRAFCVVGWTAFMPHCEPDAPSCTCREGEAYDWVDDTCMPREELDALNDADRPTCTDEVAHVCGCDGVDYVNRCAAYTAGFEVAHARDCE